MPVYCIPTVLGTAEVLRSETKQNLGVASAEPAYPCCLSVPGHIFLRAYIFFSIPLCFLYSIIDTIDITLNRIPSNISIIANATMPADDFNVIF